MINNLANFKRLMVIGRKYVVTYCDERIPLKRICTVSQSNSFAGKIDDNSTATGNDSWMEYGKSKNWTFEGNKAIWHDPECPKYFVCFELEGDII